MPIKVGDRHAKNILVKGRPNQNINGSEIRATIVYSKAESLASEKQ